MQVLTLVSHYIDDVDDAILYGEDGKPINQISEESTLRHFFYQLKPRTVIEMTKWGSLAIEDETVISAKLTDIEELLLLAHPTTSEEYTIKADGIYIEDELCYFDIDERVFFPLSSLSPMIEPENPSDFLPNEEL